MPTLTIKCCSNAPKTRHNCKIPAAKSLPKPVAMRMDMLKEEFTKIRDNHVSSISALDTTVRDIVKKELDLHKTIADKWKAIAKDDLDTLSKSMSSCVKEKAANANANANAEADVESPAQRPPAAAEAYYEPWVLDD